MNQAMLQLGAQLLGKDRRTAVFETLRAGWTMAAQAFALYPLAHQLARAPMPAFEPTPSRIAHTTSDYRLRALGGTGEPILIVSSMINRAYILDLHGEHSFLAMLRALGRPVYVLEWLDAKLGDERSCGDVVAGPIRSAVEYVCAAHASPALSLVGYSMGGTLATCFAARYGERVARLATLCAPIRFDNAGAFTEWLGRDRLDAAWMARLWNRVPSQLVHLPFWWLDPAIKFKKLTQLAESFERPGYIEHFFANETWNHDNVDLPGGVFRSWIGELYQRNALVAGELVVGGRAIDISEIRCPKLVVSGTADTITPPACAEALPGARVIRLDASHVGVLTSRRALTALADACVTWLGERA